MSNIDVRDWGNRPFKKQDHFIPFFIVTHSQVFNFKSYKGLPSRFNSTIKIINHFFKGGFFGYFIFYFFNGV